MNCNLIAESKVKKSVPADLPDGIPVLRSFYLYLTNGCNLACRHCWITPTFGNGEPSPGDCLDFDALCAAVETARPMGLSHVKLTGGEPMLHPQFREIALALQKSGLSTDMETNGTLIDADAARFLRVSAQIGFISVSIDSVDPAAHDAFRGIRGAHDRAIAGVRNLIDVGYRPQIIMSPHRGNVGEVDALVEFAVGLGAGSVKFNPVTKIGRGRLMHEHGEALDYDETMRLIHYVNGDLQRKTPIRLHIGAPIALLSVQDLLAERWRGVCNVENILGILGTGHIAMCGIGREIPALTYGILGRDDLRQIWIDHPMLRSLREKLRGPWLGVCSNCIHADLCRTGCLAINYANSGSLIAPSELCKEADTRGEFPKTRQRSSLSSA